MTSNPRILTDENVEPHGTRNFWNQNHHSGTDRTRAGRKTITQTIVAKKREKVRDDLRETGDRARDRLVDTLRPRISIFMETVMMIKLTTISESESNCSEQWYELDDQEQEALISLRDARKKLQHTTKSRRFCPKAGGRARSTGKPIDELKKVVTGKKTAHRSRKKRLPLQRAKVKVVDSGEKNLMTRDEEFCRTTRLWRSTTMVRKLKRHI